MAKTKSQRSLDRWTRQKWRTPSGKKSSETGEVYAPEAKIKSLKSTAAGRAKLARANKKKRAATKAGKQHARHGLHSKGKRRRTRKFVGGRVGFAEGGDKDFQKLLQTIKDQIISREQLKKIREENKLVDDDGTIYPDRRSKKRSEDAYLEVSANSPGKYPTVSGMKDETIFDIKNRMRYGTIKGKNEKERYESLQKLIEEQGVKERKDPHVKLLHPYEVARLGYPYDSREGYNEYRFFTEDELLKDRELRHFFNSLIGKRYPTNIFNQSVQDPRGKTAFERNAGNIR